METKPTKIEKSRQLINNYKAILNFEKEIIKNCGDKNTVLSARVAAKLIKGFIKDMTGLANEINRLQNIAKDLKQRKYNATEI